MTTYDVKLTRESHPVDVVAVIDSGRFSPYQMMVWGICFAVDLIDGFNTQVMAFAAPAIVADWHLVPSTFGSIFAAGLIGLVIGNFGAGPIADRYGRKGVIIWSTIAFALFTLLTAWASSFYVLVAIRVLAGIGLGGVLPNTLALTSEYSPARLRSTLISTMFCGFPLGAVVAGFVSSRMIPAYGWQSVFYLGTILPILLLPVIIFAMPESVRFLVASGRRQELVTKYLNRMVAPNRFDAEQIFVLPIQPKGDYSLRKIFMDGRLASTILVSINYFFNLLVLFFLGNWLPLLLQHTQISPANILAITALFYFGGVVGCVILSRLIDKTSAFGVLIPVYCLSTILAGLIGYMTGNIVGLTTVIFFVGFCVIGGQTAVHPITTTIYPTSIRATGLGWALGIGRIGSIVGSLAGGIILGMHLSIEHLFLFAACSAAFGSLSLMGLAYVRRNMSVAV